MDSYAGCLPISNHSHSALWTFEQHVAGIRRHKIANVRQIKYLYACTKLFFDSSVCRRVASVQGVCVANASGRVDTLRVRW